MFIHRERKKSHKIQNNGTINRTNLMRTKEDRKYKVQGQCDVTHWTNSTPQMTGQGTMERPNTETLLGNKRTVNSEEEEEEKHKEIEKRRGRMQTNTKRTDKNHKNWREEFNK